MKHAMLARKEGSSAVQSMATKPSSPTSSLRIGEPNDAFEQEADRVANEITGIGSNTLNWSLSKASIGAPLQRKCACESSGGQGECEECKQKTVQRRASGSAGPGLAPPIVHEVLRSPGRSLDKQTREYFEPRFGHDFSKVRVHTDGRAAESARAVNALAYTVGNELVFADRRYAPHASSGQQLLAHELAHVVQQSHNHNSSLRKVQRAPDPDKSRVNAPDAGISLPDAGSGAHDTGPIARDAGTVQQQLPMNSGTGTSNAGVACPAGFTLVANDFTLSSYFIPNENEFPDQPTKKNPCGLEGAFRSGFLERVKVEGSGRAANGKIIRFTGKNEKKENCFEVAKCDLGASGRCLSPGTSVAVDPVVIPLGTRLWIQGFGNRIADDTGGHIKKHRIDLYLGAVPATKDNVLVDNRTVCRATAAKPQPTSTSAEVGAPEYFERGHGVPSK